MQVSKFVLAVCATTVCAGFLSANAQDTPAQAAARAALLQSMGEPATVAPAVPAAQPPPPAPKAPAAPAAPAPAAPAATPVVMTPQPADNEAQAKARAALLQAMGQPATATAAPVAVPTATVTSPMTTVPTTPVVTPVAATPAKAGNTSKFGNEAGFAPIVAPPLPISAAKEQQLDALLVQYKADQISSEEYHKQRATILAEPDATSH